MTSSPMTLSVTTQAQTPAKLQIVAGDTSDDKQTFDDEDGKLSISADMIDNASLYFLDGETVVDCKVSVKGKSLKLKKDTRSGKEGKYIVNATGKAGTSVITVTSLVGGISKRYAVTVTPMKLSEVILYYSASGNSGGAISNNGTYSIVSSSFSLVVFNSAGQTISNGPGLKWSIKGGKMLQLTSNGLTAGIGVIPSAYETKITLKVGKESISFKMLNAGYANSSLPAIKNIKASLYSSYGENQKIVLPLKGLPSGGEGLHITYDITPDSATATRMMKDRYFQTDMSALAGILATGEINEQGQLVLDVSHKNFHSKGKMTLLIKVVRGGLYDSQAVTKQFTFTVNLGKKTPKASIKAKSAVKMQRAANAEGAISLKTKNASNITIMGLENARNKAGKANQFTTYFALDAGGRKLILKDPGVTKADLNGYVSVLYQTPTGVEVQKNVPIKVALK